MMDGAVEQTVHLSKWPRRLESIAAGTGFSYELGDTGASIWRQRGSACA